MTRRPVCRCCGKPIPKASDTVYAPREPGSSWPIKDWQYRGNGIVTAKRYVVPRSISQEKRLDHISVWDGETYRPRYKFFCSIVCAARFGQQAATKIK